MKRYIAHKDILKHLDVTTSDAIDELGSEKVITHEALLFRNLPFISIILTDEHVEYLKERGIEVAEEKIEPNAILAAPIGYEKRRGYWYKTQKKAITGKGCKVMVIDTGCNDVVVPVDFQKNFINPGDTKATDVYGHGTLVSSIIKHPDIAVAPDCIFYAAKALTDDAHINESAVLAAIDWAMDNEVDVINMSWMFYSETLRLAIVEAQAAGIIFVGASGNNSGGTQPIETVAPACYQGVVACNNITPDGSVANINVLPTPSIPNSHGVTVACNGVACQAYTKDGNYTGVWGTSFSAPYFVGGFAIYKEMSGGEPDNQKVLDFMLSRVKKQENTTYFGLGTPSF